MNRAPVLNLTRLDLERLPGITRPFALMAAPGVNLIIGPNEVGKSSVARAVFHLLWPAGKAATPFSVRGAFTDEVGPLQARRIDNEDVVWTRDGAEASAPELPAGHVARCYRLGLLDLNRPAAGDLDQELAREIRRQMAGGFDLTQVRDLFPDQSAKLSRQQKQWARVHQELQQCQIGQKQLAEQERGLADKEKEYARAAQAAQRLAQLEAAREYRALRARHEELTAQLADLPPDMARVREDDAERLADLQGRLRKKGSQIRELKTKITQRAERIAQLAVTGNLAEMSRLVQQAEAMSIRVAESARSLAAAEAEAAAARGDLDAELLAADIPAGAEAAFIRLGQAHRDRVERRARADDLDHLLELALLCEPAPENRPPAESELPDVLTAGRLTPPGRTSLFVGIAGLGAAAVLFQFSGRAPNDPTLVPWLPAFAWFLVGAGTAVLGTWLRARLAQGRARRELEDRCRAAGRPLPAGWRVADAMTAFLDRSRQAGEMAGAEHTRGEMRHELRRRRDGAQDALRKAATARQDLLRELGCDEHRADTDLLHELDQLARWRAAHTRCEAARGAHDQAQAALMAMLSDGQSRLTEMGLEVEATLVALQAGWDKLRERQTLVTGWRQAQADDEPTLRQAEAELAADTASRQRLLERLALPPLAAQSRSGEPDATVLDQVAVRVAALPEFAVLTRELSTVNRDLERARSRLAGGDNLPDPAELLALSAWELDQRLAAENRLAADVEEQSNEIARIKDRIASARRGNVWEKARAEDAEKSTDLAELLDEQRLGALGRLFLDTIDQRHEHDTRPPLLTETNRHLGLFTGGRYRLRVAGGSGGDQRFVAVDNADRILELSELSDGTRAQLLLAARLAFLIQSEDGLQAPLFMDEVLTASDPVRFNAIVGAVGALAADSGRQVFYLTNSPADLAAWQQALAQRRLPAAHVIDLAAQRGLADAATWDELDWPEPASVPRPGTDSAAAFGVRLQVPALRPWDHETDVHLFHLWRDDLDLVRDLVVGGVATLGQWRRLGRDLVRAGLITEGQAARIDARGALYGAFLDVWRVGRGRPLTRDDLVRSQALSPAMLPPAVDLLHAVGGDGGAFMAGVRAGKVKHLIARKKEALQEFLERHGHLDSRPVWPPDEIVAHVLGAVSESLTSQVLTPDEGRRLVLDLHRAATAD